MVRVASRHPERAPSLLGPDGAGAEMVEADVQDEASVASALAGAFGTVNAVSLYVERGGRNTFRAVHVEAAARVARLAREAAVERLVHVSGIGADAASASGYIRARGEGEAAVREAFPGASLVRPSVMFGPDDHFLTTLVGLLRILPIYPLFGWGQTRLQPVHVEDVAEAIARVSQVRPALATPATNSAALGPTPMRSSSAASPTGSAPAPGSSRCPSRYGRPWRSWPSSRPAPRSHATKSR